MFKLTAGIFPNLFVLYVYIYLQIIYPGFSLGRLHMNGGGTSAGGQSINGGTHEGDIDLMGGT